MSESYLEAVAEAAKGREEFESRLLRAAQAEAVALTEAFETQDGWRAEFALDPLPRRLDMSEHERLVQGESEMREAQEIAEGDVAPMPDLGDTAGGSQQEGEQDGRDDDGGSGR